MNQFFEYLYSSYTLATIDRANKKVLFENKRNGWFEEVELSPDLGFWLLTNEMEVRLK